ncbi:dienelactone hydrolase endo-1-3,1,4-beta-D-glucanase [Amylostereum chailletii]|nr:dienelactone hydrolase endo-1-3,1,4-beta-D-glucanase [Amylostereum chailletii]
MSCDNCRKGSALPGTPIGAIIDDAYYSPAPSSPGSDAPSKSAMILLMDAFGFDLDNPKIMADTFAQKLGMDVWVPDIFDGTPIFRAHELDGLVPEKAGGKLASFGTLRFAAKVITRFPRFYANRPAVIDARIHKFIDKIKKDKGYEKFGAVGYCYGGAAAVRLGATHLVNSIVVCHPGTISESDIKAIRVPTSWCCAEEDMSFKPALRKQAEAIFLTRKEQKSFVDYEFKDWKGPSRCGLLVSDLEFSALWIGMAHGFAARPDTTDSEIKEAYEGGIKQTVSWFKKTL